MVRERMVPLLLLPFRRGVVGRLHGHDLELYDEQEEEHGVLMGPVDA